MAAAAIEVPTAAELRPDVSVCYLPPGS